MEDNQNTTEAKIAIQVNSVSKTFKLPHEKNNSIKSFFIRSFKKGGYETQKALKNVSFDIKEGEFFGVVGKNGSGKSTLLKILAGIYSPTSGSVQVNGALTPFIELGVGFNPNLTGRENVFLNGALLGFSRKDMNKMYDDIVEFAELGKFMEQKLKNYSSGMQVRLAFSIAIRAETDILVLDEVLAVGDEAFQQKCIDIFEEYKAKHKTIVLVTHDMEMVRRFCSRAILINDGVLIKSGNPREVAAEYTKLNFIRTEASVEKRNKSLEDASVKVKMFNQAGKKVNNFSTYDEMTVEIDWPEDLDGVENIGIAIHKNSGEYIFGDNTFDLKKTINKNSARYKVKLDIGPGTYYLVAGVFGDKPKDIIDFLPRGPEFIIKPNEKDEVEGLVRLSSEWKYE